MHAHGRHKGNWLLLFVCQPCFSTFPPSGRTDTQRHSTVRPTGKTAKWTAWKGGGSSGPMNTYSRRSSIPSVTSLTMTWPCPLGFTRETRATAVPRREARQPRGPSAPRNTSIGKSWSCALLSAPWLATDAMARSRWPSENSLIDMSAFQIKWWASSCVPGNTDWCTLKGRCYGKAETTMFWLLSLSKFSGKST